VDQKQFDTDNKLVEVVFSIAQLQSSMDMLITIHKTLAEKLHMPLNVDANLGSIGTRHQSEVQHGQPQPPTTRVLEQMQDDGDGVV
jgi:hypothetical protein